MKRHEIELNGNDYKIYKEEGKLVVEVEEFDIKILSLKIVGGVLFVFADNKGIAHIKHNGKLFIYNDELSINAVNEWLKSYREFGENSIDKGLVEFCDHKFDLDEVACVRIDGDDFFDFENMSPTKSNNKFFKNI